MKISLSSELVEVQKRIQKKISIRRNFRTANSIYGEISVRQNFVRQNFLAVQFPYAEIFLRRNFLTAKFPYGEISGPGACSGGVVLWLCDGLLMWL